MQRRSPEPPLELGAALAPAPRVHGGVHTAELRTLDLGVDAVLDFSSSTNPYGPHELMRQALTDAIVARYPDSSALLAREALSRSVLLPPSQIVLGNGAADLLWSLARNLLAPGDRALIVEPTFSEFGAAAAACGADVHAWRTHLESGFSVDVAALGERAAALGASVIYLCSPNTPTGSVTPAAASAQLARAHPGLTLILDQSFLSLSESFDDAKVNMPDNVAVVRSLTKDHGIPGVRVGYVMASVAVCRAIEARRPAWTTSAFAQAATLAACECADFVRESRERLLQDRQELAAALTALGIETVASRTNFMLARVPDVPKLRSRLLAGHGILVRDCASFGLPGFMRLAAKPSAERSRLIQALRAEATCR
jgi:histidinol-phosphate/aromatic aminotransferase/cobyric acid decarboxylase-like protein